MGGRSRRFWQGNYMNPIIKQFSSGAGAPFIIREAIFEEAG